MNERSPQRRVAQSSDLLASPAGQVGLLTLHRALDFRDLWTSLQQVFESLVPHDTLVMSANYLDWRREATAVRLHSERSRIRDERDLGSLVAREGQGFFQPFLDRFPGISCYAHTQVLPDPALIPETRFYQHYMTPLGWRYSAHLLFWREGGVETSFALRRRADQGDFSAVEMQAFEALHPHIAVAFDRVRAFENERQRRRMLERFYHAKPESVLFLDWDLRVLYASHEAMASCAAWNLGPERARSFASQAVFTLPAEIVGACEELKATWRSQIEVATATETSTPLTVAIRSRHPGYEAALTLRRDGRGALTLPIFSVRLRTPDAWRHVPDADDARERLLNQLTPSERELSTLVCSGLSNKEIAAQLNKTEGSVKVQLSGVFAKLRVNSRARMIIALRG